MSMKVKLSYRKTAHPRTRGGYQGWERTEVADTLNVYDNTEARTPTAIAQTYDARGNGNGASDCTITGDHQDRVTDYTALALEEKSMENEHTLIVRRLTPTECV